MGKEILYTSPVAKMGFSGLGLELQNLWIAYRTRDPRPFLANMNPSPPIGNALYIDGPIITLPVTWDSNTQAIGFDVPTPLIDAVRLGHGSPPAPKQCKDVQDFIVMDTKHMEGALPFIQFKLLMLHWDSSSVARRAGVLTLEIASGLEAFWDCAKVRRSALWLV
jgi:hypothetical protein